MLLYILHHFYYYTYHYILNCEVMKYMVSYVRMFSHSYTNVLILKIHISCCPIPDLVIDEAIHKDATAFVVPHAHNLLLLLMNLELRDKQTTDFSRERKWGWHLRAAVGERPDLT